MARPQPCYVMTTERIGPIEYPKGLPWRIRLALWFAPELREELAHWGEEVRRLYARLDSMRDY